MIQEEVEELRLAYGNMEAPEIAGKPKKDGIVWELLDIASACLFAVSLYQKEGKVPFAEKNDNEQIQLMYDDLIGHCQWMYAELDEIKLREDLVNQSEKLQHLMGAIAFGAQAIGHFKDLLNDN